MKTNSSKESTKPEKNQCETSAAQEPTPMPNIPMPNPGEGGPVYPENLNNMRNPVMENDNMRMHPMENNNMRMPTMENNSMRMPTMENNSMRMPPMENIAPNIIGTVISTYPRPNEACQLCNPTSTRTGYIRFLNAATGYNPFVIFVNQEMVSSALNFAEITDYEKVSGGNLLITVMGENGYIYVQKQVEVIANTYATIALVNTESGIDIQMIADNGCDRGTNMSCIRAANLSYNSGPLTVVIGNQYVNFPNLRYRAVADFESIWPGLYIYTVSRNLVARFPGFGGNVLLTAALAIQRDRNYTIYLLNWKRDSSDTIKALIVEDM